MPWLEDIRFRLEYGLIRVAAAGLRLLPVDVAANVSGRAVALIAPYTSLHKRALENISLAFADWPEDRRQRTLGAMWRNTGRMIAETLLLDRIVTDPSRIEVEHRAQLQEILGKPGAHIAVTLHMGNWEISGIACGLCGGEMAGVYRPMRNPYLNRYLLAMRSPFYPAGLLFKQRNLQAGLPVNSAAIAAINILRNGSVLGLVCDQVDPDANFTVPFFGADAKFTPAPAILARHTSARIWIARCRRLENGSRFLVNVKELPVVRTRDRDADMFNMTSAIALQFEEWIRETPEQWMWWQRRKMAE